ncbi:MAG TPA: GAP family protein [Coriobacteriia bacterium]|nr:GAP family protein [Coriobacteriia bacterium]
MSLSMIVAFVGIALVDSLNPTLFAGEVLVLRGSRPERRALAYIAGVVTVNLIVGVVLAAGVMAFATAYLAQIGPAVWLVLQTGAGVALLVFGLVYPASGRDLFGARREPPKGVAGPYLFGFVLTLTEMTTAVPYFAAMALLGEAGLPHAQMLFWLVVYNLIFALPLIALVGAHRLLRRGFEPLVRRLDEWVRSRGRIALKYACLLLGVVMLGDAAHRLWAAG